MQTYDFSRENILASGVRIGYEDPVSIKDMRLMSSISVGRFTYFRGGRIGSLSSIGRFCSVAPEVVIGEGNHPTDWLSTHPFQFGISGAFEKHPDIKKLDYKIDRPADVIKSPPSIGNDVWIGGRVTILRGVKIGDGAIIGTGSVVNRDVEPYEIVAGTPIRHLRYRFDASTIEELRDLSWWDYNISGMSGVRFDDISQAIIGIRDRINSGSLVKCDVPMLYYRATDM